MKKIFQIVIFCLLSVAGLSQSITNVLGDTVRIKSPSGGNTLLTIQNATKSRTGAYLKNTNNGRTEFDYAIDSAYQIGGTLYLLRANHDTITIAISGSGVIPNLQDVTNAGASTTNSIVINGVGGHITANKIIVSDEVNGKQANINFSHTDHASFYLSTIGGVIPVSVNSVAATSNGNIAITTSNIGEGLNLYYTNARVDSRVQSYTGDVTLTGTTLGITAGSIVNADVSPSAAISITKLNISGTPNGSKFLRDDSTWAVAEAALTFSTGLTRSVNTITNNLSTGVSGGQSVIGGTGSNQNLTFSSTTNADKGKFLFGTSGAYSEKYDQFSIGNTTIPSEASLFVNSPNSSGTNVDIRASSLTGSSGTGYDAATVEVQPADYVSSLKSAFLQYSGSAAIGSTMGITNVNLAQLTFQDPDNAIIRTTGTAPIYFAINSVEKLRLTTAGSTFSGTVTVSDATASTIAIFNGSKNLISAATATYPSLTELAYVKGVTSAIQTQIDSKLSTSTAASTYLPLAGGTMTGHLLFTNNTYDIGADGVTSPRSIYAGTNIKAGNYIVGSTLQITNNVTFKQGGNGILNLLNFAENSFDRLNFGPATSSFPAIKRNGVGIDIVGADGVASTSNFLTVPIHYGSSSASGNLTLSSTSDATKGNIDFATFWRINSSGHLLAQTDNTYDFGASGATRPRHIYAGGQGVFGTNLTVGSTSSHFFQLGAGAVFRSPSTGVLTLLNGAETDFGRINLGGTTSSFPAIKRNGVGIDIVGADGVASTSNFLTVPIHYGSSSASGNLTLSSTSDPTKGVVNIAFGANEGSVSLGGQNAQVTLNSGYNTTFFRNSVTFYAGGNKSTIQGFNTDPGISIGYAQTTVNPNSATTLSVKGSGSTSSTKALVVENSSLAKALVVRDDGYVGMGTASPGANLQVHSTTGSNVAFVLSDADVTLPNYSGIGADPAIGANEIARWANWSGTTGGFQLLGFTSSGTNNGQPVALRGYHGGTSPTTAAILISGFKHNGSTNATALTGTEVVLDINTGASTNLIRVLANGNTLIGTTTDVPSSKFTVASTTQGSMPFPVMTNAQRTAISSPATGLFAYSTDATEGLYVNRSDGWKRLLVEGEGGVSADPTATIGLTAVNGSATTFMRSDAAPALSQAIAPEWTGTHTFNKTSPGNFDWLQFKNSNVAHGITDVVATNIFGSVGIADTNAGGLFFSGLTDVGNSGAIYFDGYNASTPTVPVISFRGWKKSGTARTALTSTDPIIGFYAGSTKVMDVLANGRLTLTGQLVITPYTPSGSSDATHPNGTLTADNTYLYFRTSTGTWVKKAWDAF